MSVRNHRQVSNQSTTFLRTNAKKPFSFHLIRFHHVRSVGERKTPKGVKRLKITVYEALRSLSARRHIRVRSTLLINRKKREVSTILMCHQSYMSPERGLGGGPPPPPPLLLNRKWAVKVWSESIVTVIGLFVYGTPSRSQQLKV